MNDHEKIDFRHVQAARGVEYRTMPIGEAAGAGAGAGYRFDFGFAGGLVAGILIGAGVMALVLGVG